MGTPTLNSVITISKDMLLWSELLARLEVIKARIRSMEAANDARKITGASLAYHDDSFAIQEIELEKIADELHKLAEKKERDEKIAAEANKIVGWEE